MTACEVPLIDAEARARAASFVVPKAERPERVVVALSGGVDSAAVAWLMREAGHEVIGVTLRLAPDDSSSLEVRKGRCCSIDDMTDARQLCDALDIPFYAVDARDRFKEAVFDPFVADYRAGRTPIPCLACNHVVKFGDLFRTATELGAHLATGHYARVVDRQGRRALARPHDRGRDQTYYLHGTAPEVLDRLMLPLGDLDKPLVRALCARAEIPVAQKPDSQEICFVPDGDHAKVVERASGPLPAGELVHLDGRRLREHEGVHRFTVGQRRGIGVGTGERLYVVDVDADSGQVTVGPKDALAVRKLRAQPLFAQQPVESWPEQVSVQIRARHRAQPARVVVEGDGLEVTFDAPVEAVAPGQSAVVYDGDVVLGGGVITARLDGALPRSLDIL